jgi:hypothetical protein
MGERPYRDTDVDELPDEVPGDEALDVDGPNESAPGHNPDPEDEGSE